MPDLTQSVSPTTAPAASPSAGPAATTNGTTQPTGEARHGATESENFVPQGTDLNTMPPAARAELERINKEMVRGWTAKTQKLADEHKKYEGYDTYRQKAERLEQLQANQDFVRLWNEHVQKTGSAQRAGDPANTSKLEQKLQEIETKMQQSEIEGMVKTFREMKDDKGEPMHPDFESLNTIGLGKTSQGDDYSLLRACVELSQGNSDQEKLANGYKAAKAIRDQIYEEGRKSGMGKMLARVRNSTNEPTLSTDKTSFNGEAKKLSAREARELAEKGVRV